MPTHAKAAPARPGSGFHGVHCDGEHRDDNRRPADSQDCLIGDLQKNRRENVRIQLRTFKGAIFADIRVHFPDDDTGEMRPTGKGVSIKPSLLPELITLLTAAEAEARKRGLL